MRNKNGFKTPGKVTVDDIEADTLRRFLFEKREIRGEIVHLDASWRAILSRHEYPEPLRKILGEMITAAVLLSATIKLNGKLIIQAQGDGKVKLMVVECTADATLRAMARYTDDIDEKCLQNMLGNGRLVITIEPQQGSERYQGIVSLEGENIATMLKNYLLTSEQLDTELYLAVDSSCAAGMLLQKLPAKAMEKDEDAWRRIVTLGSTVKDEELLGLSASELIQRLFHEEDIRVFEPETYSFRCTCSKDRVTNALKFLGHDEVKDILNDQKIIRVNCEFCNQRYEFDAVDAEQIFASEMSPDTPDSTH